MYKVKLQSFEGPFDLLVYLIESAEMSIYDIRISEITSQYLDYIRAMEEQNIEVAQEFMVLAASLIEIKSRMILPRVNEEGEPVIEEDPRKELVQRILEYKHFKEISEAFRIREERMSHVYSKPQEDISEYLNNPDEYLSLDIGSFAAAFRLFIQRKQRIEAVRKHYTRIERERSTMEHRIGSILKTVRKSLGSVFNFRDLVEDKKDKYDIIVTFSSLLEMAKERVVNVEQKHNYGNIEVSAGENVEKDDILRKYSPEEFREETLNE
ncbi:MAG: segregation/condensation protein A [Firmicutes bacterium]|nr:chromosome segregation protein ScpA [Clostridiales bacterium]MBR3184418.1 segregation/condensation protein A [Bacillota bacterium]MBR3375223.1 segregation/condensation protein A [Bacillota bacterium]MBR4025021.1 segregation/condensation protein A [Bacillota bacterium]MBR6224834.1 segregation/condensation protein A [Bacillota bacterium]